MCDTPALQLTKGLRNLTVPPHFWTVELPVKAFVFALLPPFPPIVSLAYINIEGRFHLIRATRTVEFGAVSACAGHFVALIGSALVSTTPLVRRR